MGTHVPNSLRLLDENVDDYRRVKLAEATKERTSTSL